MTFPPVSQTTFRILCRALWVDSRRPLKTGLWTYLSTSRARCVSWVLAGLPRWPCISTTRRRTLQIPTRLADVFAFPSQCGSTNGHGRSDRPLEGCWSTFCAACSPSEVASCALVKLFLGKAFAFAIDHNGAIRLDTNRLNVHASFLHGANSSRDGATARLPIMEANDEWTVQRGRYLTLETMAQMSDDPQISLPAVAR